MSRETIEQDKLVIIQKQCESMISLFKPFTDDYGSIKCAQKCSIQLLIHSSETNGKLGRLGMNDKEYWTKCVEYLGKLVNPFNNPIIKCKNFVGALNEPHYKCDDCQSEEWEHKL